MGSTTTPGATGSKSTVKILANIFISFIGAGVLGLPYAFREAGIVEGTLIMVLVGAISVKAMILIIDCKYRLNSKNINSSNSFNNTKKKLESVLLNGAAGKEEVEGLLGEDATKNTSITDGIIIEEPIIPQAPGQELTYGDVGYYALGNKGRLLVEFSIVFTQTGFCCAYLVFICENLKSHVPGFHNYEWLILILPPLMLMTFLRHLHHLAVFSLLAQCSNLMAFGVVFWFDFDHFEHIEYRIHPKKFSLKGLPFFLAVAIYCYEGAGMILSLESSLHPTVRHKFKCYFKSMLTIISSLYVLFGVCGYLSFGRETHSIITLNLPRVEYGCSDPPCHTLDFAVIVKTCLVLALYFTYPMMLYPVIAILEKKIFEKPTEMIWKGNILRIGVVILTGLVVLAVPNFANLMALVGASCCTLLAFILPGVFHYKIFSGSRTYAQTCFDIFLIVLGIVGAIIGTVDAVMRLIQGDLTDTPAVVEKFRNATLKVS